MLIILPVVHCSVPMLASSIFPLDSMSDTTATVQDNNSTYVQGVSLLLVSINYHQMVMTEGDGGILIYIFEYDKR